MAKDADADDFNVADNLATFHVPGLFYPIFYFGHGRHITPYCFFLVHLVQYTVCRRNVLWPLDYITFIPKASEIYTVGEKVS
jgi:hypothetical protein